MRSAVFLDRDGTINEDVGYLDRLERLTLFPWSIDAVRLLNAAGFCVVVLTNQRGVATGVISEEFVDTLHGEMRDRFSTGGASIERFYYCPHDATAPIERYRRDCSCRKPKPGMALQAIDDFGIDPTRSFVVGDRWSDVAVARNIGATGILVRTGYGVTQAAQAGRPADAIVAADLMAATVRILAEAEG
ncbi:MAG: HAD family hydrolase [Vicinamibacterales bacterium]|nr:HAD family hydrolase [Vicinamibacterales bacterium]MDP7478000.1 HAD family hydrolase [Vicinamibacterales bacterium]MDP7690451.1 HAD family hydrolase [Vicinamibacterales bacterium]HJN43474.1 HAD family hydrolase [Vicinamibacterales bacterium]